MGKQIICEPSVKAVFFFFSFIIFHSYVYGNNGGEISPFIFLANVENVPIGTNGCDGTWDDPNCWMGGTVPSPGDDVTIVADMVLDVDATVFNLNINMGATLTSQTGGRTLTITPNGSLTANGTFTANDGTVLFQDDGTVSGTVVFNNVTLDDGGVDFGTGSTLNGTLTIESNGFVNNNSPTYASGSTLKYNAGGIYGRRTEWDVHNPHHVLISNATEIDMAGPDNATGTARTIEGNLTLDGSCGFYMDYAGKNLTAPVNINGDILNNGTFSLSGAVSGDLNVGGNFTQNGTFNCNERAVQFNGSGTQNLGGSGTIFIDYLDINTGGQVVLGKEVTVDNELRLNSGKADLGAFDLTLNGGLLGGSDASYVITSSTGAMKRNIGTGAVFLMPIGVSSSYNPFYLENNGSISQFSGHVEDGVSGVPYSGGIVNRLWEISDLDGVAGNVSVTLQWNNGEGINGFSETSDIIIGHEEGAVWVEYPATTSLGSPNTATATGFNSFSPFVVANLGALPVEMDYFGAAAKNNFNLLSWRTLSETNNSHFEIQRAEDAQNWKSIGRVEGGGNSLVPREYSFADRQPLSGQSYYRLRQMDFDGRSSFSKTIAVERRGEIGFQVYPNPVLDELFLVLPSANEDLFTARIFDLNGQLLASQNWLFDEAVSVVHLRPGIYLLEMSDETRGPVFMGRFIKK